MDGVDDKSCCFKFAEMQNGIEIRLIALLWFEVGEFEMSKCQTDREPMEGITLNKTDSLKGS